MFGLGQDLRFGLRLLRHRPFFLLIAVLSLAIGIGANTAVYSMLSDLLFRELPVEQSDRLVRIWRSGSRFLDRQQVSFPEFRDLRDAIGSLSSISAFTGHEAVVHLPGGPARVGILLTSANYLDTLGVEPLRGRWYEPNESTPVTVISYALWEQEYKGSETILGRTLRINAQPFEIVGVLPEGFRGLDGLGEPKVLFVSLANRAQVLTGIRARFFEERSTAAVSVVARLAEDAAPEQLQAEIEALAARFSRDHPATHGELGLVAASVPGNGLDDSSRASFLRATRYLGAVSAMILLIVCINLTSLLLGHGVDRKREVALRFALGASRGRVTRQLLAENLILGLPASLAAIGCALLSRRLLWSLRPPLIAEDALLHQLDWRLLGIALLISLLALVLAGTLPALTVGRSPRGRINIASDVKPSSTKRQASIRKVLIGAQVAIATLVVAGAVLTVRSLVNLLRIDPGFATTNQHLFTVDLEATGKGEELGRVFYEQASERISALPGVESVALAHTFFGLKVGAGVATEEDYADQEWFPSGLNSVSPSYFETLEIPLLFGRQFDSRDRLESPPVTIVNRALAQRAWPDEDPIGQRLWFLSQWHEVIGVAGDAKAQSLLEDEPQPAAFQPFSQRYEPNATFHVRAMAGGSGGRSVVRSVENVLRELDPEQAISRSSLTEMVDFTLWLQRSAVKLLAAFAAVALLLAAIGIYGSMSLAVRVREHELGVRAALGARASNLLSQVMNECLRVTAGGVVLGLAGMVVVAQGARSFLFDLPPYDSWTLILTGCILAAVAMLACLLPALRAARADPIRALREE